MIRGGLLAELRDDHSAVRPPQVGLLRWEAPNPFLTDDGVSIMRTAVHAWPRMRHADSLPPDRSAAVGLAGDTANDGLGLPYGGIADSDHQFSAVSFGTEAGGEFDSGKKWPPMAPSGADIDANIREAEERWDPFWFEDQVKNRGPWDYKQLRDWYEDYGNFHFGAVGAAFGFPESILLNEAGRAQVRHGTSDPDWGRPGYLRIPQLGTPPYGDDPRDQYWIKRGIDFFRNREQWLTPPRVGP